MEVTRRFVINQLDEPKHQSIELSHHLKQSIGQNRLPCYGPWFLSMFWRQYGYAETTVAV